MIEVPSWETNPAIASGAAEIPRFLAIVSTSAHGHASSGAAWRSNRLKRLVRSPKRYLTDAALLAGILRVDANAILREGDLLGRLIDTFVASQLRAELAVAECRPRLYHLRQEQGRHEIDILAEISATQVIAIEVKANAAPRAADAPISPGSVTSLASASSGAWCFTPDRERTSSMIASSRRQSPRSGHNRPRLTRAPQFAGRFIFRSSAA
jgi:hypothetical protein